MTELLREGVILPSTTEAAIVWYVRIKFGWDLVPFKLPSGARQIESQELRLRRDIPRETGTWTPDRMG